MITRTLTVSAFSIQRARPNYVYGQPERLYMEYLNGAALVRAAIPADIPKTAVVVSATLRLLSTTNLTGKGDVTIVAWRSTSPLRSTATWNSAPAHAASTSASFTMTSPPGPVWVELDVTADLQGFVSGTLSNNGWRVSSTLAGAHHYLRGATSANNAPELVLTYWVPDGPPTDLMPDGAAVGTPNPTTTFTVPDGTVSVQVQVDAAANGTAPGYDSGEVPASGGLLDLSRTDLPGGAFTGPADGASTYWRARYKHSDFGWSAWSTWATFSYASRGTLSILTPDAAPSDPSPTISWSFTGRTQSSWRARVLDANSRELSSSGWRSDTDTAWQPPKGFTRDGQTGFVEIVVRDTLDRVSVPGFPASVTRRLAVTLTLDGTVPPMDTLVAVMDGVRPVVPLTGTRSEIPDEVIVFRSIDGGPQQRIARLLGTDVFTGTAFAWDDYTAPMGRSVRYRVAPVTAGKVASGGPTQTLTTTCRGMWLADPETGEMAVLWNASLELDKPDVAIVHQTISGALVRRRLGRPPRSGTVAGTLVDAEGLTADDSADALAAWDDDDAGHVLRLVAGEENMAVTIGDITLTPTEASGSANGRVSDVTLSVWEQVD